MIKMGVIGLIVLVVFCVLYSSSNLEYVKEHAPEKWRELGYKPIAYEGFQWGLGIAGTHFGGARVWHNLRHIPDNGINYTGSIKRWGDELHVYGPKAIDAIKP